MIIKYFVYEEAGSFFAKIVGKTIEVSSLTFEGAKIEMVKRVWELLSSATYSAHKYREVGPFRWPVRLDVQAFKLDTDKLIRSMREAA